MRKAIRSAARKGLSAGIALLILFGLCACGGRSRTNSDTRSPGTGQSVTDPSAGGTGGEPGEADVPSDANTSRFGGSSETANGGTGNAPPAGERSDGIDVSEWQGKIDWAEVKADGTDFAFIRIGYRGGDGKIYRDEAADYNLQQAEKAGVPTGVYFFSAAITEREATAEAEWTLNAIESYPVAYPVVYDCEGFRESDSRMHGLSATARTDCALAYLKTVAAAGYDTMLYGAAGELGNDAYWEIDRVETDCKIWVAQYAEGTDTQSDAPNYDGKYDAWQYTDRGTVRGITGNVDRVVCYFTKGTAKPKNPNAKRPTASAPLTAEERRYAAVNETVTAKDITNLREAPSTDSRVVGQLKNGETLKRTGLGDNGWSKLDYNGRTVYAVSSYLTADLQYRPEQPQADIVAGNTFTAKKDRVTAKDTVNLRARPTTDSEIVGTLKSGTFLERTAVSDKGWSRLTYNNRAVYAVTSYLTDTVTEKPPENTPDGFTATDEQVTAKAETNLRTKPTTGEGSEVVYTLKKGEYVRRTGVNSASGWSKLEYNGQTVYAVTSYLTAKGG